MSAWIPDDVLAIEALGGIASVKAETDVILASHGIERSLFDPRCIETYPSLPLEVDVSREVAPGRSLARLIRGCGNVAQHYRSPDLLTKVLRHLVGAKLDLVLGVGAVKHHGFSVADQSSARAADFHVGDLAIHVTTAPTEALIAKCVENLTEGLRPMIITTAEGTSGAAFNLTNAGVADRVDVLDVSQFLVANVYERSFFKLPECAQTLTGLIERFNAIVEECETDPVLVIRIKK